MTFVEEGAVGGKGGETTIWRQLRLLHIDAAGHQLRPPRSIVALKASGLPPHRSDGRPSLLFALAQEVCVHLQLQACHCDLVHTAVTGYKGATVIQNKKCAGCEPHYLYVNCELQDFQV